MSKKLHLQKVEYDYKDLSPVMSKDTLEYHRDHLAKGYVTKYNNKQGDEAFNEAGAFLHNIFFPQLKGPSKNNKPEGACLELINGKHESFDNFKNKFEETALSMQGSGWVYMSISGDIKTIPNHAVRKDIALLVDWWEHAWALDYQHDKVDYLKNMWRIIDWDLINDRLNMKQSSASSLGLTKLSSEMTIDDLPKRFPMAFRRWIREGYYSGRIDSSYDIGSRSRLANWMFNRESDETRLKIYQAWKLIQDAREDSKEAPAGEPEVIDAVTPEPLQLDLFSEDNLEAKIIKLSFWLLKNNLEKEASLVCSLSKHAVLRKKVRKTRGKGKKDRKEWGLFSKKNPKKVLRWFGPKKPSKKQVAKEEARVHAFAGAYEG